MIDERIRESLAHDPAFLRAVSQDERLLREVQAIVDGGSHIIPIKETVRLPKEGLEFREVQDPVTGATRGVYRVVLLVEGPGNPRDKHYYSADSLKQAVADRIFEGLPMFIDHPGSYEEQDRPERSVRDMGGWYENIGTGNREDGKLQLESDLVTIPGPSTQWIRDLFNAALMKRERDPQSQDLVGLSINATGVTDEMDLDGEEWHNVSRFLAGASVDVVTKAGAGGKIVALKEGMERRVRAYVEESKMSALDVQRVAARLRKQADPKDTATIAALDKIAQDLLHESRGGDEMGVATEAIERLAGSLETELKNLRAAVRESGGGNGLAERLDKAEKDMAAFNARLAEAKQDEAERARQDEAERQRQADAERAGHASETEDEDEEEALERLRTQAEAEDEDEDEEEEEAKRGRAAEHDGGDGGGGKGKDGDDDDPDDAGGAGQAERGRAAERRGRQNYMGEDHVGGDLSTTARSPKTFMGDKGGAWEGERGRAAEDLPPDHPTHESARGAAAALRMPKEVRQAVREAVFLNIRRGLTAGGRKPTKNEMRLARENAILREKQARRDDEDSTRRVLEKYDLLEAAGYFVPLLAGKSPDEKDAFVAGAIQASVATRRTREVGYGQGPSGGYGGGGAGDLTSRLASAYKPTGKGGR